MNHAYPVYTVDAECQDCYKCVRHCPVKAIRVKDGHAAILPELCVACGKCVEVCPVKAKHVRNDTGRLKLLFSEKEPVYASLAPSWVSEFPSVDSRKMTAALKKLGFTGISETALGAQLVSTLAAEKLDELSDSSKGSLHISSACPTCVDFICKYIPDRAVDITPYGSPLMAHCRYLRDTFGENIKTVFIGPCIAKKNEADRRSDLLNLAITYPELRQLFRESGIEPERIEASESDVFVPESALEGAVYPVEGGMNDTIKFVSNNKSVKYVTMTGLENVKLALDKLNSFPGKDIVFAEVLACPGGCVHGPCSGHDSAGLVERLRVIGNTTWPDESVRRSTAGSILQEYGIQNIPYDTKKELDVLEALRSIGKYSAEDELNCDSCGYDTCRTFARALLAGHAEPSMCVSYLKKQAQKKANALLRSIPSGVVITDKNLRIIECNRNFAALFDEDTVQAFDACPGLAGADARMIVPFPNLLESALQSGSDIRRDSFKWGKRLFNVTVFNIEPREVIGVVIFDVTTTEMRREHIASRARQVIERNIETVQEIACRLGEQMADTELLLRSIADDYADENDLINPDSSSCSAEDTIL